MSEPIVQSDFGGFNPRFPGVTIKFESGTAFAAFQDFLVCESVPHNEPDLATAVIRSVLDHEVRHYHDFLISPYSAVIFRMRLQAALNGIKALQVMRNRSGAYLPVPLVRWVTLPLKERIEYAYEWCEIFGAVNPETLGLIDLPYIEANHLQVQPPSGVTEGGGLDDEHFLRASLEYSCRAYLRIGDLTAGVADLPDLSDLAPYTLHEVIALAAQAQSIWLGQGVTAAQAFLDELETLNLPYAQLWRRIQKMANTVEMRANASGSSVTLATFDQMVAISLWCLLGNYQIEGTSACPTARFFKLAHHLLSATSATDIATDVGATWSHWDLAAGVTPWRESLAAMLEANDRGARQYETLAAQQEMPSLLAHAMHRYVADQRRIVEHLLATPNDLVHMNRYCKLSSGVLPLPIVRIEFDRIGVPLEKVQDTAFKPIWKVKSGNQYIATRLALRQPIDDFEAILDDAMEFESLMHWCDVVFSDHEMPSDVQMHARRGIEEFLGKRLLNLV
jgi:hypothetical protein